MLIFVLGLVASSLVTKSKKPVDKFADRYNPDKAALDPNKHAWRSCYEIQSNKCVSWGWTPIPKGCAVVYSKCNYLGTAALVCGDLRRLARALHRKVSSVKLGPNTGIELFARKRHGGDKVELKFNEPCLINHKFNAKARSLRLSVSST